MHSPLDCFIINPRLQLHPGLQTCGQIPHLPTYLLAHVGGVQHDLHCTNLAFGPQSPEKKNLCFMQNFQQ